MRQVLFNVPLNWLGLPDFPVYGYGVMLCLAFIFCTMLARRLGWREGIQANHLETLAIFVFVFGILGARLLFMVRYHDRYVWDGTIVWQFIRIWDGGLILYGSMAGGLVGYIIAYRFYLRQHDISTWKVIDIVAPCAALGLALGRLGCLLNGCCYGNVACPDCPAITFPLASPPRFAMVERGHQTAAGFFLGPERTVQAVEPNSPAAWAGLQAGDVILKVDNREVVKNSDLTEYLHFRWPRGKNDLQLTIRRAGQEIPLEEFAPRTIGLHPTQIYESVSMVLLLWLLLCYYPFKRHDGSVMVLFMLAYAVHRFVNEMLRTDTEKVLFDLTLSQNISIGVLAAGVLLGVLVWRRPVVTAPTTSAS